MSAFTRSKRPSIAARVSSHSRSFLFFSACGIFREVRPPLLAWLRTGLFLGRGEDGEEALPAGRGLAGPRPLEELAPVASLPAVDRGDLAAFATGEAAVGSAGLGVPVARIDLADGIEAVEFIGREIADQLGLDM